MQALLIDSSIYIFKSYFSFPEKWHAEESQHPTQAVYGFTNFLLDLLKKQQPEYIFCAFDESPQSCIGSFGRTNFGLTWIYFS